jgi:hypothetical protein
VATQPAVADGFFNTRPEFPGFSRFSLDVIRASGLAQARLQLAVLSGNRHRALEQIDRLVTLDKELERIAEGTVGIAPPPDKMASALVDERLAIASEKLALASVVHLPRLEPAFGAGMGEALGPDEPVEIVEDEVLAGRFTRALLWASGFVVLTLGVAAAAASQMF